MSRSNIDKPFFVDVGTSIAAVRCQSNRDVLDRFDHIRLGKAGIEMANNMCDRMNAEVEKFIADKDAEIARWREKALHEGAVAEALRSEYACLQGMVSDATVKEGNLREEIVRLRKLVEELAGVVSTARPKFCNGCPAVLCTIGGKLCGFVMHADELVEIARKVIGGAK